MERSAQTSAYLPRCRLRYSIGRSSVEINGSRLGRLTRPSDLCLMPSSTCARSSADDRTHCYAIFRIVPALMIGALVLGGWLAGARLAQARGDSQRSDDDSCWAQRLCDPPNQIGTPPRAGARPTRPRDGRRPASTSAGALSDTTPPRSPPAAARVALPHPEQTPPRRRANRCRKRCPRKDRRRCRRRPPKHPRRKRPRRNPRAGDNTQKKKPPPRSRPPGNLRWKNPQPKNLRRKNHQRKKPQPKNLRKRNPEGRTSGERTSGERNPEGRTFQRPLLRAAPVLRAELLQPAAGGLGAAGVGLGAAGGGLQPPGADLLRARGDQHDRMERTRLHRPGERADDGRGGAELDLPARRRHLPAVCAGHERRADPGGGAGGERHRRGHGRVAALQRARVGAVARAAGRRAVDGVLGGRVPGRPHQRRGAPRTAGRVGRGTLDPRRADPPRRTAAGHDHARPRSDAAGHRRLAIRVAGQPHRRHLRRRLLDPRGHPLPPEAERRT